MLLRVDPRELHVEDRHRLVAVLSAHLQVGQGAARRHVRADRAAVTAILVRSVRVAARAGEVPAAHDAGEPAAARRAARVDHLAGLEDLVELQRRPDLPLGGELGLAAELLHEALGGDARLLEVARERLRRVLLLALLEAEDEGGVAVLLLGALAHDDDGARLDDGDSLDRAVLGEDLRAAELAAVDTGLRVHGVSPRCPSVRVVRQPGTSGMETTALSGGGAHSTRVHPSVKE